MFGDNVEVSSSGVEMPMNISMWTFKPFKMRPPVCLEILGTNYPATTQHSRTMVTSYNA